MTVKRYPNGDLVGFCEGPLRHHMELRGIGIINVQDLFGLAAVRERTAVDLVIELEHWETGPAPTIGWVSTRRSTTSSTPPAPTSACRSRSVATSAILVEIAARNHVLKLQGHHSAREFARKLEAQLERSRR